MFLDQERYVDLVDHIQIQAKTARRFFFKIFEKQYFHHLHQIRVLLQKYLFEHHISTFSH